MVVYTRDILGSTDGISDCPMENTPSHWPQWYAAHKLAPLVHCVRQGKQRMHRGLVSFWTWLVWFLKSTMVQKLDLFTPSSDEGWG